MRAEQLQGTPNPLAQYYSQFRVGQRVLLTGHSHQAWPDAALAGQLRAWEDAAEQVDGKWERAFAQADRVRRGFAERLQDETGLYALGASTHELLVRFLSAVSLRERPRLVTTDGEFYTVQRQLSRLAEAGVQVVRVPAAPAAEVGDRLAAAVDDRTAAVISSTVFFGSGAIGGGFDRALAACQQVGAELLLDAYHQINVVPFTVPESAFVIGGGYKYCQLGEGCCFLRFPRDCSLRPVITGWFADFDSLDAAVTTGTVGYSADGNRFAGATYDPVSHYRGAAVFEFLDEQGLTPTLLRSVSQRQVGRLCDRFDALELDPLLVARDRSLAVRDRAGFLALTSPKAAALCDGLRQRGVLSDFRGTTLRLGPAPYLSDRQLDDGIDALAEAVSALA